MEIPAQLFYTKSHEWARQEAGQVVVGVTAHAQQELRDVVFVELPKVGRAVRQGEAAAVIESVKAAFDIYAPISGTIVKANDAVAKQPQLVNQDCYGQGWLFAISPSAPDEVSQLLSPDGYRAQLEGTSVTSDQ